MLTEIASKKGNGQFYVGTDSEGKIHTALMSNPSELETRKWNSVSEAREHYLRYAGFCNSSWNICYHLQIQ